VVKFLNSEQAKAETAVEEEKTLEELRAENEALRQENCRLSRNLQAYAEQVNEYARRIANLEIMVRLRGNHNG
jgi:cell division protein FtsB